MMIMFMIMIFLVIMLLIMKFIVIVVLIMIFVVIIMILVMIVANVQSHLYAKAFLGAIPMRRRQRDDVADKVHLGRRGWSGVGDGPWRRACV